MKTAVTGYPRIGEHRELKFKIEDYFKGKISKNELSDFSKTIRKKHWLIQADNKVDYITSNDFSFYDNMLDTAFLFNIIPEKYKELKLDDIDTYFAMARGYQKNGKDITALPMKKWFNTNYHYIVPLFEDNTKIKSNINLPLEYYKEALQNGIKTKPTIIGPFTFIKLSDFSGRKSEKDFLSDIINVYLEIINKFELSGAEWFQFEEPYLVKDLSSDDKNLFIYIYNTILKSKGKLKILLQTYFGDIRDIYSEIIKMQFDGLGLDFIEGKKTVELIKTYGFPKNTILFAGVINGKNIWKNNYVKTIALLNELKNNIDKENIVINTSCSLLHIPYSVKNETKINQNYIKYLAFAEEKLTELNYLKFLTENDNSIVNILQKREIISDKSVQNRLAALCEKDFTRLPPRNERKNIQKKILNLPLFPTTTIGSFPQTKEIKTNRSLYKSGEKSLEEYKAEIKNHINKWIALQEKIGLDVLVHGEFERNDMVEYFGENLEGFIFSENGWVQSYGTRCVKPPIIWSDIKRSKPFSIEYITYAQSLTNKYVKGMLTGPVTILNWSFPREDISNKEMSFQIALAIKDETEALEKNGIKIIQIDEAALKEKLPLRKSEWNTEYLDWAIPSFRLVTSGLKADTQIHTHMCYSDFNDIIKNIDDMDADVISFEAARSNLEILKSLKNNNFQTQTGPGIYDIHSPRIPKINELENAIVKILNYVSPENLWINPDCGLKTRGEEETIKSLENLNFAALNIRKRYEEEK